MFLPSFTITAQHKAIARKVAPPSVQGVLGMELEKAKAMQLRIEDFTRRMSELLRIERDAELEFTQEELDAVPRPDDASDSSKPIEFLVSHGQAQQELCDTICNLNAVSTSTGLSFLLSLSPPISPPHNISLSIILKHFISFFLYSCLHLFTCTFQLYFAQQIIHLIVFSLALSP